MAKTATTAKTAKISTRKRKVEAGFSVQSLLGLALLLVLLCILPSVSSHAQDTDGFRVLQLSLAFLVALLGGLFLGLQIASNRKK